MGGGIESPHPIEGCAGPTQCRPGEGCHAGAEEQENADGSYSARHLVPNDSVGARARTVPHPLTIPRHLQICGRPDDVGKRPQPEYCGPRSGCGSVPSSSYGENPPVRLSPIRRGSHRCIQHIPQRHDAFQLVHIRTGDHRQDFDPVCPMRSRGPLPRALSNAPK